MLELPFQERPAGIPALAVRHTDGTVLTCAACGCRLTPRDGARADGPDAAWRHFPGSPGHDARGCQVDCVDEPHRMSSTSRTVA